MVVISDTGIGMEPRELERVFGAFAQGTHHFGGLGLGLAISRALVELQAGSSALRARQGQRRQLFQSNFPWPGKLKV